MENVNNTFAAPFKLKILVTICEREKVEFYRDVLEGFDVNFQSVVYGRGTAPKELYDYIDTSSNKAILISVVKARKVKEILINYEDKYFKTKKGKAVAFTISMDSIIGKSLYQFLANMQEEKQL